MFEAPEVLFMCTHNAGRSQMAAALLAREGGGRVRVTSAGSEPASQVNPAVAEAMGEIGIDISREIPKPLGPGQAEAADIVISTRCGDACPVFPGRRYLVWDLPDPAGLSVEQVRPIREDIAARVQALLAELTVSLGREDALVLRRTRETAPWQSSPGRKHAAARPGRARRRTVLMRLSQDFGCGTIRR